METRIKKTACLIIGLIALLSSVGLSDFSCYGTITGMVTDSDGTGIAGAIIETGSEDFTGITDSYGEYEITGLPGGVYNVFASSTGWESSDAVEVSIVNKLPLVGVKQNNDFTLIQNGGVSGTVVMKSSGTAVSGAIVRMSEQGTSTVVASVITNVLGEYEINNIEVGDYTIYSFYNSGPPDMTAYIGNAVDITIPENGMLTRNFELEPETP